MNSIVNLSQTDQISLLDFRFLRIVLIPMNIVVVFTKGTLILAHTVIK